MKNPKLVGPVTITMCGKIVFDFCLFSILTSAMNTFFLNRIKPTTTLITNIQCTNHTVPGLLVHSNAILSTLSTVIFVTFVISRVRKKIGWSLLFSQKTPHKTTDIKNHITDLFWSWKACKKKFGDTIVRDISWLSWQIVFIRNI